MNRRIATVAALVAALTLPGVAHAAVLADLLLAAKVPVEKNGSMYTAYVNVGDGEAQTVLVGEDTLGTSDIKIATVLVPLTKLAKGQVSAAVLQAMLSAQSSLAMGKLLAVESDSGTLLLYQSSFLLGDATAQEMTYHLALAALSSRELKKSFAKLAKAAASEG